MAGGPADKPLDLFKSLVFDQLIKQVVGRVVAWFGLSGWALSIFGGPLTFIVGIVVGKIGDFIYEQLKDYVNIELIILKNTQLHGKFVQAQLDLKTIALSKGLDSKEFKDAREKQADAFADFILNPVS